MYVIHPKDAQGCPEAKGCQDWPPEANGDQVRQSQGSVRLPKDNYTQGQIIYPNETEGQYCPHAEDDGRDRSKVETLSCSHVKSRVNLLTWLLIGCLLLCS